MNVTKIVRITQQLLLHLQLSQNRFNAKLVMNTFIYTVTIHLWKANPKGEPLDGGNARIANKPTNRYWNST